MDYSLRACKIWLNWCQYMTGRRKPQVSQDEDDERIWRICCLIEIEAERLTAGLMRPHVEGGGLWLWKHEGKEKTVAQKDGTKGSAYSWTPQRLLGTKLKPWSNGYRMLLRSEQKLRC